MLRSPSSLPLPTWCRSIRSHQTHFCQSMFTDASSISIHLPPRSSFGRATNIQPLRGCCNSAGFVHTTRRPRFSHLLIGFHFPRALLFALTCSACGCARTAFCLKGRWVDASQALFVSCTGIISGLRLSVCLFFFHRAKAPIYQYSCSVG